MKIKKTRRNKFILTTSVVLISVILSGFGFWLWQYTQTSQNPINNIQSVAQTVNYNPPTVDQKQAGEDIKAANQTPISTTASTTITAKNVTADILQVRSVTNGVISSDGICNLTLTKDGVIISKSVATYAMPSSSTCQGFDIARTELSKGIWQINLEVIINSEKSSTTSEISLE